MHSPITAGRVGDPDVNRRRWLGLALLSAAQFMLIVDVTVVAVALPDIAKDVGLGREPLTWVVGIYTLMFGGAMLVGGRVADVVGRRRMVMIGLGLFVVASASAGLATSPAALLAARAGQGLAAAMLSPAALALLTISFEGVERGRALAVWSSLGGAGSAVGVLVGGALSAGPGWPWVFAINVPIGVVVLAALPWALPTDQASSRGGIDVLGSLMATAATASLIYGLIRAGDVGWGSPHVWVGLLAGIALYVVFGWWQGRTRSPLIRLRLLARREVLAGILLILVATAALVGGFFLASFALQQQHGWGALQTGLAFLPVALSTIVGSRAAAGLVQRYGLRLVGGGALLIAGMGAGIAGTWPDPVRLIAGQSVAALGLGAAFVSAFTLSTILVDRTEAGAVAGVVNTFHEFGASLGVAGTSTVAAAGFTAGSQSPTDPAVAFSAGFALLAATSIVGGVVALLVVPRTIGPVAVGHGHGH